MWVWGWNWYGILGQNENTPYYESYPGVNSHSSPTQIPGTKWKYPASGDMNALAIRFAD